MAMNRIQFQPGLSMPEFFARFGTEAQCESALVAALLRSPNATPERLVRRACNLLKEMNRPSECDGLDTFAAQALNGSLREAAPPAGEQLAPHLARKLLKQPGQEGVLWFNAGAADDALRQSRCRPNLLHTLPGRAMQADALAQYLVAKRWKKWYLVTGPQPEDAAYAAAIRRAAKRFGGQVAYMAHTGLHHISRSQKFLDGLNLGR